jgi:hypothetical protein
VDFIIFEFLSPIKKCNSTVTVLDCSSAAGGAEAEVTKYTAECKSGLVVEDSLAYWLTAEPMYPALAPLCQDIVAAPASEAFCERVFSFCSDLTARKRNRASKSLQMSVFLKFNKDVIDSAV